ncbi:MAG: hypothetical protein J0H00_16155 [Burkholderiales bacterium]|nr:hypothetical protein [Burkholderiales bacterium]OJX06124.1 MAG: hypothetical protein BGO72_03700 [Burkholderiales bacterium 70-64]
MKWKLLARRLSVSAPRMAVRRYVPWPVRLLTLALAAAIGAGAGLWLWRTVLDRNAASRAQLAAQVGELRARLAEESGERERLAARLVAGDSALRVDEAAAERLAQQLKALEAENAELKSDLAYLESLLPAGDERGPVAVRRFEVRPDSSDSGRMRYRALVMQTGRGDRVFTGSLQLVVTTAQDGRTATFTLPEAGAAEARERMQLSFRRLLRVQGRFDVPRGATVKSVELRVLERGAVRARQSVAM